MDHLYHEVTLLVAVHGEGSGGERWRPVVCMQQGLLLLSPGPPAFSSCSPQTLDISLGFVTGLSHSEGNTTIVIMVDRFSKMVHFIPFAKFPSTKQIEVILSHVFLLHGLPRDAVSNRGHKIISLFWKAFCSLLGATDSLSSGYHQYQSIG